MLRRKPVIRVAAALALGSLGAGCVEDGESPSDGTASSETALGETAISTIDSTGVGSSIGTFGSSSFADSGDTTDTTDTAGIPAGVLARASFVIPAGTVVEEFQFETRLLAEPGVLASGTLVVAVRDLTHPRRDQATLCPGSHPLDGCATVDYGAFGMTHDNRVTFEGPAGPWSVHLYKDRSLELEPEPLALNE